MAKHIKATSWGQTDNVTSMYKTQTCRGRQAVQNVLGFLKKRLSQNPSRARHHGSILPACSLERVSLESLKTNHLLLCVLEDLLQHL